MFSAGRAPSPLCQAPEVLRRGGGGRPSMESRAPRLLISAYVYVYMQIISHFFRDDAVIVSQGEIKAPGTAPHTTTVEVLSTDSPQEKALA